MILHVAIGVNDVPNAAEIVGERPEHFIPNLLVGQDLVHRWTMQVTVRHVPVTVEGQQDVLAIVHVFGRHRRTCAGSVSIHFLEDAAAKQVVACSRSRLVMVPELFL